MPHLQRLIGHLEDALKDLERAAGPDDAPESFKLKPDANGEPSRVPLQDVEPYVKAVRTNHNLYHPNEAAADLMARLVSIDALGFNADPAPEALESVRNWAREAFGVAKGDPVPARKPRARTPRGGRGGAP